VWDLAETQRFSLNFSLYSSFVLSHLNQTYLPQQFQLNYLSIAYYNYQISFPNPIHHSLDWLQRFTLGPLELSSPNPVARVGATEQLLNPQ
jgi:hypothetical protein